MSFRLDRVHVWSCEVSDKPGGVAEKLSVLAHAGANLQYVGTRRLPDKPGTGILYVAPLSGAEQFLRLIVDAGERDKVARLIKR